ncbi:MAG: hypothetical protein KDJ47_08480 [Hyphomicrobiaceae bacterium]|nr:hypothetical protein [Hyphomicrobiaceae bacterium]
MVFESTHLPKSVSGQRILLRKLHERLVHWESVYSYLREVYSGIFQKIAHLLTFNAIIIAASAFNSAKSDFVLVASSYLALTACVLSSLLLIYSMALRFNAPYKRYGDAKSDCIFLLYWMCSYGRKLNSGLLISAIGMLAFLWGQLFYGLSLLF